MRPGLVGLIILAVPPVELVGQIRSARLSVPSAPTMTVAAVSTDAIQVGWSPVAEAFEYRVLRGLDPAGPFVLAGVAASGQQVLLDRGLVPGTGFHYRVEAMGASAAGARTSGLKAATPPIAVLTASARTMPGPSPAGFTRCPAGRTTCVISWQPVPAAIGYAVYENYFAVNACRYGRRVRTQVPEHQTTVKGVCPDSYQAAAIFAMRDFPTAGATFEVEGPRATFRP